MSYTTRCPACGTTFRVVPDQLKISDGWVRCGHCADVFDATLYLQTWTPPPATAMPEPVVAAEVPSSAVEEDADGAPPRDPRGVFSRQPASQPAEPTEVVTSAGEVLDGEAATEQRAETHTKAQDNAVIGTDASPAGDDTAPDDRPMPADDTTDPGFHAAMPDVAPDGVASRTWTVTESTPLAEDEPDVMASSLPDTASDAPLGQGEALSDEASAAEANTADFHAELTRFAKASGQSAPDETDAPATVTPAPARPGVLPVEEEVAAAEVTEPSFVRQARRQAFWRSPAVRMALAVLALLLGGLLGLQWVLHERDALAASHPELAPLLTQLCGPLGCELGPVRRIDAVVIDSSTLARRLGNFYAFDLVIKNTASVPVAVPALELSLTDTRDSVIARRVFLQSELPGAPTLLPAQGSLPLSLRLSITESGAASMAGYRALVFYP